MNMIENYLLNVFLGKLIARGAVTVAGGLIGFLATDKAQSLLALLGVHLQIDQTTMVAGLTTIGAGAAHAGYEWFKARRMANPASPAVQTDQTAPGGTLSAAATVQAASVNKPQ